MTRLIKPQWLLLALIPGLNLSGVHVNSEDGSTALLQQDKVKRSPPVNSGFSTNALDRLTDGKTGSPLELSLQPGVPLDIVYHLPEVATCQKLVITADLRKVSKEQLPRIELLVSTLSAQAGYQSMRALTLKNKSGTQQLEFPAVAARWVIVRMISPVKSTTFRIDEIDLQGYPGVPKTRYAFKEAPAKAFQVLAAVQKSVVVNISQEETELFEDAGDGQLDEWSLAEAALLSNGIIDPVKRNRYLAKIDRITEQVTIAVKPGKTPYEKGELLLKWLHAHPMANGYDEKQTDLSVILDTGKFNCVSSATLFNIIGRRLSLDVRAIEVPDHAFSIQYVGTRHADVETTNAAGFNPARDPRVLKQFNQQTGFNYIPERHAEQRREVSNIGLLALTCYNHGVFHSDQGQYAEALVDFFRALNLDPEFPSAIQAVLVTLAKWSGELIAQEKFEQGLEVIAIGLRLAPEDRRFRHNQKAVWQAWAIQEIKNGHRERGLEIFKRAAQSVPGGGFDTMQTFAFTYPGSQLVEANQWEAALELAQEGLKILPVVARPELQQWRNSIYNRWAVQMLGEKKYSEAADILERASVTDPKERTFSQNIAFLVQEWLATTQAKQGLEKAESLVIQLAARFQSQDAVSKVVEAFLKRSTVKLIQMKQYSDGSALVDRHQERLSERTFQELHRGLYEVQAGPLRDEGQWEKAIAVYEAGLVKLPKDRQLTQNLVFTWGRWSEVYQKSHDWSGAAEVYLKALESGIDNRNMERRLGFCVRELAKHLKEKNGFEAAEKQLSAWVFKRPELKGIRDAAADYVQDLLKNHQKAKQPEKMLVAIERCKALLVKKDHDLFIRIACDQWAQSHQKKMEWEKALAVYELGLKSLPNDTHLTKNATNLWNQQGVGLIKQKQWAAAIKIYEAGLQQFPKSSTLRRNLKYCQQQSKQ